MSDRKGEEENGYIYHRHSAKDSMEVAIGTRAIA